MSSNPERSPIRPLWCDDNTISYVDQRYLPDTILIAHASGVEEAAEALTISAVTGTRCVRLFCAFALALERRAVPYTDAVAAFAKLRVAAGDELVGIEYLCDGSPAHALSAAHNMLGEEIEVDRSLAAHLAPLLPVEANVMTIGGTGALCTGGLGTAAGGIIAAHDRGQMVAAYVAETRPTLTGARLTATELRAAGVRCSVFLDAGAAALMSTGSVAAVIVGAEALAANGDTIAELGTFAVALAAAHHRIPLFVATPRASIDTAARDARASSLDPRARGLRLGDEHASDSGAGRRLAPLDVTPGNLITAIVTEFGVSRPPFSESLAALATRPNFRMLIGREAVRRAQR